MESPFVTTGDITLASQAEKYCNGVLCVDDVDSLVRAIAITSYQSSELQTESQQRKLSVHNHFSVKDFRRILVGL